jgi:hypothetical protein
MDESSGSMSKGRTVGPTQISANSKYRADKRRMRGEKMLFEGTDPESYIA